MLVSTACVPQILNDTRRFAVSPFGAISFRIRREACIPADVSVILTSVPERSKISVCGNVLSACLCLFFAVYSTPYVQNTTHYTDYTVYCVLYNLFAYTVSAEKRIL